MESAWLQFILCTPVFLIGLQRFGKSAFASLKLGVYHMDLLILIGSTSAFIYSTLGMIWEDQSMIFFETAAMIITLVLIGNFIEERTVKQTSNAIEGLKKLQQNYAMRLDPQTGQVTKVQIQDLRNYDQVMVNEGDAVPSDGIILSGEALIDESMLTGESAPKSRVKGDEVIGATIVVSGSLRLQITRTGTATVLSNMIELVKKAQREKPGIQRLADRISHIFVPTVITISVITFLISYFLAGVELTPSILNSIAVLVVSCPCAMGLATPTAIAAGVGQLSRNGMMVKSGQVLQNMSSVRKLLFDKTGTLTEGKIVINDFRTFGIEPALAKSVFYELEKHSSHPIATAIVKTFRASDSEAIKHPLKQVKELRSEGIVAEDEAGDHWKISSVRIDEPADQNTIGLFRNNELVAIVHIGDTLRSNARQVIGQLQDQGYGISIISGDKTSTVAKVAAQLGIESHHSEMKPEQKYDLIEQENLKGHIAMIGDGINDAAALHKAAVGISFSEASRIAINSADIVLMRPDLSLLPKAFRISKATMTTIRQNLFWAFSYNIVAIPMAAAGMLNPMLAALLMSFSDLIVVGNSIRLVFRKFK